MTNDTTRAMPTVEEISELADLVDSTCWGEESRHDAAVMLRTIADQMRKNEPVAWMEPNEGGCINALTKREAWASDVYTIPLYTIACHMRKSEPVVWMIRHIHTGQLSWVVDEEQCVFPDRKSAAIQCESINDAEDSDVWEVLPLYTAPLADAEDARRYRWLCDQCIDDGLFIASGSTGTWGGCGHSDWVGMKNALDERIDAAMKEDSHDHPTD